MMNVDFEMALERMAALADPLETALEAAQDTIDISPEFNRFCTLFYMFLEQTEALQESVDEVLGHIAVSRAVEQVSECNALRQRIAELEAQLTA